MAPVPLKRIGLADVAAVGRKAAVLGELVAAGFEVPDGVVVTAADTDVQASVAAVGGLIGPGPYAVRSSGVAEDGADASFAGLYESELDVPAEDLAAAVVRCRASAGSARVRAYAGGSGAGPIAVLVQRMVDATAAGVAFTADPVTGARDVVVVSAVRGLGDRLVRGVAPADEWTVCAGTPVRRGGDGHAVDEPTVLAVAALARRVAEYLGAPQDIEWAVRDGAVALLQARPITALPAEPVPVAADPPDGFWERESGHAPKPWTPMQGSVFFAARNDGMRTMFATFGFLVETLEFREIGGWDYARLVPLGGKDRKAPPAWLMPLLIRAVPAMRRRIRTAVAAARDDAAGRLVQRWYGEWQPQLSGRIETLRGVVPADLDDAELSRHTDRVTALFEEGCGIHFLLHGALGPILAELAFTCRDLLGWTETETFELVNGLSVTSTRPAHRLADLAALAGQRTAVRDLLAAVDATTPDRLRDADPDFAARLDAYLAEYGHRALRYEIADPTIAEVPVLTLRLLADQLERRYDPEAEIAGLARRRAEVADRARSALTARPAADRARFERALARAQRTYPIREDNEFLTFSVPLALLRYAVLEHGRRLARHGRIPAADDVFFLTLAQARAALAGDSTDLAPVVTRRKGERNWALLHPGPASYGTPPGPPPSFAALPDGARFLMEALLWTVDRIFAAETSHRAVADGAAVTGLPASPGRYTGPVRVVRDELEFDRIQPGDVLVCPVTSPVWSVLFPTIGALVTDSGGLLSHPAIIAREYRLPAVVATANATTALRDGQLVTVDGTTGRVEPHD